jgi:hypothetical protein
MDQQRIRLLTDIARAQQPVDDPSQDDEREIRFSLTALGEAAVYRRRAKQPRFAGFGPCGCLAREVG